VIQPSLLLIKVR